jgi:hypothetical protein
LVRLHDQQRRRARCSLSYRRSSWREMMSRDDVKSTC